MTDDFTARRRGRGFVSILTGCAGLALICAVAWGQPRQDNGLTALDANGDGAISRQEALAGQTGAFQGLDANGDGVLSLAELPPPRIKADSARSAQRAQRKARQRVFHNLDKNDDGKVTLEEYQAAMTPYFDRLDKNGDGMLDADELAAGLKPRGAQHAGGR